MPCRCGGNVVVATPADTPTWLTALRDEEHAMLDVRRVETSTGPRLVGHLDLDVTGTSAIHGDHLVVVVLAAGEFQPMREVGLLHGTAIIEPS